MPPSTLEILHSYRHIYRTSLQGVQYSSPARHVLRKLVNNAYRKGAASDFDAQRIRNTLTFLKCAAKERGLEHKLQKTLIHTWWSGAYTKTTKGDRRTLVAEDLQIRTSAFEHFEATLKMLNESMGMCLPTSASAARVDGLPVDDTSN